MLDSARRDPPVTRAQQQTKALEALLKRALKPLGFSKTGHNWRLETEETVVVVNLQKSPWSHDYYLNIGALVRTIDDGSRTYGGSRPSVVDCHFRIRLEDLFPDKPAPDKVVADARQKILDLLDFNAMGPAHARRMKKLASIIDERLLPFLELCKTEAGIRKAIVDVLGFWYMTTPALRKRLKIPEALHGSARQYRK